MKKKPLTKAERRAKAKASIDALLERVGYTAAKARGVRSSRPPFPDLKVPQNTSPTSDRVANGTRFKHSSEHPDAKLFPVGNDHKQGPRLIVGTDDLSYLGGKKT